MQEFKNTTTMKRIYVFLLGIACCLCMYASPINVNGLLYEVLSESDLTVKLVGYDKSSPLSPDLVIPSSVSIDGKDYVTRRIAAFAFENCEQLRSVTIPSSVKLIENYAFEGASLHRVVLSHSDSLVLDVFCFSLTSVGTVIMSGTVDLGSVPSHIDLPYWFTDPTSEERRPQLVVDGDIPESSGMTLSGLSFSSVIIRDNVTDVSGLNCHCSRIYCMAKTPPKLGFSPIGYYEYASVHVPEDAYAAYFQDESWSRYRKLKNDAVETTQLSLSQHDVKLYVGESFQLKATKNGTFPMQFNKVPFNWYNDNVSMTTADEPLTWNVTAQRPSEFTLVAVSGGLEDTCHVTILETTPVVTLDKTNIRLRPNDVETISYTVEYTSAANKDVVISCDNPDVAVARLIAGKIEVLGVGRGVAKLTVKTAQGDCTPGVCEIQVYDPNTNGDNTLDIADVNVVINTMLGRAESPNADLTNDGVVDITDMNMLINLILGR